MTWAFCLLRRSQFIVSVNKYLEAVNHKFGVGMRFKMKFEGEDSPETEKRYSNLLLLFVI